MVLDGIRGLESHHPRWGIFCYNKSMAKIIDSNSPNFVAYCKNYHQQGKGFHNGAYYYSKEIVQNIIPNVKTWRPWDTMGMKFLRSVDHAIVFLHHNLKPEVNYKWLLKYDDLVLVCSSDVTYEWAKKQKHCHAVFLPISIDTEYVKQFKTEKTKDACYAGNKWAFKLPDLKKYIPEGVDFPPKDLPREELLKFIAPYKTCYAVGRSALEAKCLGCKLKVCDSRYPDVSFWKLIDNKDAAKILQQVLDQVDGPHDRQRIR